MESADRTNQLRTSSSEAPHKRPAYEPFEAVFSSDAAAMVEHTRRCARNPACTVYMVGKNVREKKVAAVMGH